MSSRFSGANAASHDRFDQYLRSSGLKLTRQRAIILDCFLCLDRHVSAEDLYDEVRRQAPGIGQATVFRTLKLIAAAGIATEMNIGGRTLRYEQANAVGHHDHIQCLECGDVFEFCSPEIERLQEEVCRKAGVRLVSHKMNLYGICTACDARKHDA